jgi:hypothetical protein
MKSESTAVETGSDDSSLAHPQTNSEVEVSSQQSQLIAKILVPAVKLWLRSQVEQIIDLQIRLQAGDRQILTGAIPQVDLAAQQVIYQGIHLSQLSLIGRNIGINLGQVVRGKPLRLLQPIQIEGRLMMTAANLSASLNAPLLKSGIQEFMKTFLHVQAAEAIESTTDLITDPTLEQLQIALEIDKVVLAGVVSGDRDTDLGVAIRTGLKMSDPQVLTLVDPEWLPHARAKRGLAISELNGYRFDLGDGVRIDRLVLQPDGVQCWGQLRVNP